MSDFADFEWDLEYEAKLRACGIEPWRPKPKRPRGRPRTLPGEVYDLVKTHFPHLRDKSAILAKVYELWAVTALRVRPGRMVAPGVEPIFDPPRVNIVGVLRHLGRTIVACGWTDAEAQEAGRWIAARRTADPRFNVDVVASTLRELRELIAMRTRLGIERHPPAELLEMLQGGRA